MKIINHGIKWIARARHKLPACPECNSNLFFFDITVEVNRHVNIIKYIAKCHCNPCSCEWEYEREEANEIG